MLPVLRNRWHVPMLRDELFTGLNSLVDDFFKDDFFDLVKSHGLTPSTGVYPKVDVTDYGDHIKIEAELAGLKKDDVKVELCDGVLTIKGEKRQESGEEKKGKVIFKELKKSAFQRSFMLDDTLDQNSVGASFDSGVLSVIVKKLTPTKIAPEVKVIDVK